MFGEAQEARFRESAKAICLLSGGLDSALAAKLILEQGVRAEGVHFAIPFGRRGGDALESPVRRVADSLGIDLEIISLGRDYLEVVRNPKHGYGSNMNPCIDCRIYMLKRTADLMRTRDADFIVTGEVVGQRPMSQRLSTMRRIEKESGIEGLLVRPLSAQLLEPTVPETEGLIRRDLLLGIHGRSRKELLRLAQEKGVSGFSSPGGGCLLTDPRYAGRVRDLLLYDMLTLKDIDLLSMGRNFRLPDGSKLVVGRDKHDNEALSGIAGGADRILTTLDVPGPTGVLRGPRSPKDEDLAARIVARYSDAGASVGARIRIRGPEGIRLVNADPLTPVETAELMI